MGYYPINNSALKKFTSICINRVDGTSQKQDSKLSVNTIIKI